MLKALNLVQMITLLNHFTSEVVLRVKALRRTQVTHRTSEPHAKDLIEFDHLVIDNDAHRV